MHRLRKWIGLPAGGPEDVAERLTGRGPFRVTRRSATLDDPETVRGWLRELTTARDDQVLVHRPWGTVAAVADGRHSVTVVMTDGHRSWFATVPGSADEPNLTPAQVEHVMVDALTAPGRPEWPEWRPL